MTAKKNNGTAPANLPAELATYRKLLTICADQFGKSVNLLITKPKARIGGRAFAVASKLLRDTITAGNTARLYVAARNNGLQTELKSAQDIFYSNFASFTAAATSNNRNAIIQEAIKIGLSSEAVLSLLDGITGQLHTKKTTADRTRYPKDEAARIVLEEGSKRKARVKYKGMTFLAVVYALLFDKNETYWNRMMKPNRKGTFAPLRKTKKRTDPDVVSSAANWGKYLAAYCKAR